MELRPATLEERKRFYAEEWNKRDLPDFILHTLSLREFGFDLDGSGPNNRYNQFITVEQLESFLRDRFPYSAYASVALYEQPSMRKWWLKAELAFDIDAKDLPLKSCDCSNGKVCVKCLDDARRTAAEFAETLHSDLGIQTLAFSYSGRGFHLRALDDEVMKLEQTERSKLVEYITGGVIPGDLMLALGYSKVFRERMIRTLKYLDEHRLSQVIRRSAARRIIQEKEKAMQAIRARRIQEFRGLGGMGDKTFIKLMEFFARTNSGFTDGKVTIDTKRILRLPSTLHSGVSMKCMVIQDIERFSLDDAVPKFARE